MSLNVRYTLDFRCHSCDVRFCIRAGDVRVTPFGDAAPPPMRMPNLTNAWVDIDGAVTINASCPLCGERAKERVTVKMEPRS